MDTLQHVSLETELWRKTNGKEEANDEHDDLPTIKITIVPPWILRISTYQIDVSWIDNGSVSVLRIK